MKWTKFETLKKGGEMKGLGALQVNAQKLISGTTIGEGMGTPVLPGGLSITVSSVSTRMQKRVNLGSALDAINMPGHRDQFISDFDEIRERLDIRERLTLLERKLQEIEDALHIKL